MGKAKTDKTINADLVEAINKLLKDTMDDEEASITDKTKVIDRALTLEKIKQKIEDDSWGSGFAPEDEPEEP